MYFTNGYCLNVYIMYNYFFMLGKHFVFKQAMTINVWSHIDLLASIGQL